MKDLLALAALLLCTLGLCCPARAALPVAASNLKLAPHLSVLEDCQAHLNPRAALEELKRGRFAPPQGSNPSFGYSRCAYWFYTVLELPQRAGGWYLQLENAGVDRFEVYLASESEKITSLGLTGSSVALSERPVALRYPAFHLDVAGRQRVLIRVSTKDVAVFPFELLDSAALSARERNDQMTQGAYYGSLTFAAILNVVIFLFLLDAVHLYHATFLICYGLYQASVSGLASEYLWPSTPSLMTRAVPAFTGLTMLSGLTFSNRFLATRSHSPRLYRFNLLVTAAALLFTVCSAFVPVGPLGMMGSVLSLLAVVIVGVNAAIGILEGQRHARYFVGAGAAFLLGVALNALRNFGLLADTVLTSQGNQIGSLLAVLLLVLALGSRFIAIQRAHEAALRQASELERVAAKGQQLVLEARLQSLQAKINPHFLFNALNTITGLIGEDPGRAEKLVIRLSSLFRYALTASENNLVSLEQELSLLQQYLDIECTRFAPRIVSRIDCRGDPRSVRIPGLTLQPLVENAIQHGLRPRREGGTVSIEVEVRERRCRMIVQDDGVGFDPTLPVPGHGLASVRERLRLVYGAAASMSVTSQRGVRVEISVPVEPGS